MSRRYLLVVRMFWIGLSVVTLFVSGLVWAQVPENDEIADAIIVSGIPFQNGPIDTSRATADTDDPVDCYNNGSVWYAFTPVQDMSVEVNTFGSDYDTTLGVYEGSPGSLSLIDCNDDFYDLQSVVRFNATANTTYYFMIGFCCGNGGTGGGTLFVQVEETPPLLDIHLIVDGQGTFDKTGRAIIRGSVECNQETFGTDVYGDLRQRVGREFIKGSFYVASDSCTPPSSAWSAEVIGEGVFRGGRIIADITTIACDDFSCDLDQVSTTIHLKGKGKEK